jgi:hypothetical protein
MSRRFSFTLSFSFIIQTHMNLATEREQQKIRKKKRFSICLYICSIFASAKKMNDDRCHTMVDIVMLPSMSLRE